MITPNNYNSTFQCTLLNLQEQTSNFISFICFVKFCFILVIFYVDVHWLVKLQCCYSVQPSAVECFYRMDVVCSHQFPQTADIWRHQFGWTMIQDKEELEHNPHQLHPQVFHLATTNQLFWRHHPSLHEGSFLRVISWFLATKNDWMQIKTNHFDFCKTYFHERYFICVWRFVQMEN